jgi:hypothetical protein
METDDCEARDQSLVATIFPLAEFPVGAFAWERAPHHLHLCGTSETISVVVDSVVVLLDFSPLSSLSLDL